jgi:protein-tyrosine phosphatase
MNERNALCKYCHINEKKKFLDICSPCYDEQLNLMSSYESTRKEFYPEIDQITDNIYLGNYDGQREKEKLKGYGINGILVCGSYLKKLHPDDFDYLVFEINDSLNQRIDSLFEEAIEFIDKKGKVYVHCAAGISRSSSFVIAYLMSKNKWDYDRTYEYVKERRGIVSPNSYFVEQLKEFYINKISDSII